MKRHVLPLVGCVLAAAVAPGRHLGVAAAPAKGGTIAGHIRLSGKSPGNSVIRMGMDPMCAKINAGKRVIDEAVVTSADGGLANVFVRVQDSFPRTPAPVQPVTIDQRGCLYSPRVVGARVGQMLQVRNSDALLHNVHGSSIHGNGFNVGQPIAGMVYQFRLKDEEVMLRLRCDVHRWMTAYIGVVDHPYYAVSGADGTFEIGNVPAGSHTLQAWHERYGSLTQKVRVKAGATTTIEFTFLGSVTVPHRSAGAGSSRTVILPIPAGHP